HLDGSLTWADEDGARALRDGAARMRAAGIRVLEYTPAEIAVEVESELRIDESVPVVYAMPEQGWVDGALMCTSLLAAAQKHGARFVQGEVAALVRSGERVTAARLVDGATMWADVIVNAAGAWANDVASLGAARVSVRPRRGALVVTRAAASRLRAVVYAPEVHVRPDGGGRIVAQRVPYDHDLDDMSVPETEQPFAR